MANITVPGPLLTEMDYLRSLNRLQLKEAQDDALARRHAAHNTLVMIQVILDLDDRPNDVP